MFYIMYLTGLCQRRHWPQPSFNTYPATISYAPSQSLLPSLSPLHGDLIKPSTTTSSAGTSTATGWHCVVRVNNREYSTDVPYATEHLARNAAATRAYMICRNFSVNDGMYPGLRAGEAVPGLEGGAVQGRIVAIGAGRRKSNAQSIGSGSMAGSSSSNVEYDEIAEHAAISPLSEDHDGSATGDLRYRGREAVYFSGGDSPGGADSAIGEAISGGRGRATGHSRKNSSTEPSRNSRVGTGQKQHARQHLMSSDTKRVIHDRTRPTAHYAQPLRSDCHRETGFSAVS